MSLNFWDLCLVSEGVPFKIFFSKFEDFCSEKEHLGSWFSFGRSTTRDIFWICGIFFREREWLKLFVKKLLLLVRYVQGGLCIDCQVLMLLRAFSLWYSFSRRVKRSQLSRLSLIASRLVALRPLSLVCFQFSIMHVQTSAISTGRDCFLSVKLIEWVPTENLLSFKDRTIFQNYWMTFCD